jgi:glycosyltransferase involved in cell wall biosynthesis
MDYYPNQQAVEEFCNQVWPMVRDRRPSAQFLIVGADPPAHIRRLGELPGVTVTGSVADVRPYLAQSALTVAPLRIARGTQNKILESMAMGIPVVASSRAAAGVDAVPGEHLLTADTPGELRDAALRLMTDPAERMRLSERGRLRVLSNHDWAASMRRLDALIEIVLGRAGQP